MLAWFPQILDKHLLGQEFLNIEVDIDQLMRGTEIKKNIIILLHIFELLSELNSYTD